MVNTSLVTSLVTLLLLVVISAHIATPIEITISPSCRQRVSNCFTLSTLPIPTSTNVSLVFLPGNHRLPSMSTIRVQNKVRFELKAENNGPIITCTNRRYSSNIRVSSVSNFAITKMTFVGCNIDVSNSNNTVISQSQFFNGTNGALEITRGFNVNIDRSTFNNNSDSSFGAVLEFSNTRGIKVTRSNFTNSVVSSFSGVIGIANSFGHIGCCNFHNNSVGSFGGTVLVSSGTILYVTKSSFTNNKLSAYGGVIKLNSNIDEVTIASSVLRYNNVGVFGGGVVNIAGNGNVKVIASQFSHNRGPSINTRSSGSSVEVDCSTFKNSSISRSLMQRNSSLCATLHDSAICINNTCEECQPPTVRISLEYSQYTIKEDISNSSQALQVCVVATDALLNSQVSIQFRNGSARENEDFVLQKPDCRDFKLLRQAGTQKKCTYVRIIPNSEVEGSEEFFVTLTSSNPQVVFGTNEANVTIVEESVQDMTPTSSGPTKTAIVECGLLRRPIKFNSGGNDITNIKAAIVKSFGGLTGIKTSHIALLQIKSDKYGDFVDILSTTTPIEQTNLVKVILYNEHKDSCTAHST